MKHNRGGFLVAVLLLVIAVAVAGIVYYVLRITQTGPATATGGVEPTEPSSSAVPTGAPETDAPTETEAPTETTSPEELAAQEILDGMTLDEKLCQLFVVTPDALTGLSPATAAGDATREALERTPVGGLVYFAQNIVSAEQVTQMLQTTQSYSKIPLLLGVDEEGGRVSRLSGVGLTDVLDPMATYGAAGDTAAVEAMGKKLGGQVKGAGFNVDFAPVADIVTNPNNTEIGDRSFSSDPAVASDMVAAMTRGLQEGGVLACLKHFPGHGSTEADSHLGTSVTDRTLDELREAELLPFRAGIEAGAGMIMVSHMSAPAVTGDNTPCDLSPAVVTDLLRTELGYDGVVITDAHNMGAITANYTPGEAAVLAIEAGCDLILMPDDLDAALQALRDAAADGTLTEARIDESVLRILTLKAKAGLLG